MDEETEKVVNFIRGIPAYLDSLEKVCNEIKKLDREKVDSAKKV